MTKRWNSSGPLSGESLVAWLDRTDREERADHPVRWWTRRIFVTPPHRLHSRFKDERNRIRFAYQRVTRKWDDITIWGWNYTMSRMIGEQLIHLADIAHGWPAYPDPNDVNESLPYYDDAPDFDAWVARLRENGEKLQRYGKHDDADFYDTNDPDWVKKATAAEDHALKEAQEAFRWIADHLPSIWD